MTGSRTGRRKSVAELSPRHVSAIKGRSELWEGNYRGHSIRPPLPLSVQQEAPVNGASESEGNSACFKVQENDRHKDYPYTDIVNGLQSTNPHNNALRLKVGLRKEKANDIRGVYSHGHAYGHGSSPNHSRGHDRIHTVEDGIVTKAKELKDEGNRQFQKKNYLDAMALYKQALDLIPSDHSDRAAFYTNRAACLMQMQPVQYQAAIEECTRALEVQPGFCRALLRRAKAFEAVGKLELALEDAQTLLQEDGSHIDALDLVKRLQSCLQHQGDAHAELKRSELSRSLSAVFTRTERGRATASQVARSTSVLPGSQLLETSQINISEQDDVHMEDESPFSSTVPSVISMLDHVTGPQREGPQIHPATPQTSHADEQAQASQSQPALLQTNLADEQTHGSQTLQASLQTSLAEEQMHGSQRPPPASSQTSLAEEQTDGSQRLPPASSQTSLSEEQTHGSQTLLASSQSSLADEQMQGFQRSPDSSATRLTEEQTHGSQTLPASFQSMLADEQMQDSQKQPALSQSGLAEEQIQGSQTLPAPSQSNVADEQTQGFQLVPALLQTGHVDEQTQGLHIPPASSQISLAEKFQIGKSDKVRGCHNAICTPADPVVQMRQLKLYYHGDIRLAEMPDNCEFSELRKLVKTRFPTSRAVLIKYIDFEGDLVTITCTKELRLAEFATTTGVAQRATMDSIQDGLNLSEKCKAAIGLPVVSSTLQPLKLHVVEVSPEQEPLPKGEDVSIIMNPKDPNLKENPNKEKMGESKLDKWLSDFAYLVQTNLGFDCGALNLLQESGLELYYKALADTSSREDAKPMLELAATKFQEVVARSFLSLGNVHMCAARKQLVYDDDDDDDNVEAKFCGRLQASFDWAQSQFALAEENFEKALGLKSDLFEGILALGQQDFENAKLHWSLAIARQVDLSTWDSSCMLGLFRTAEERFERALEMFETMKGCNDSAENDMSTELAEAGFCLQGVISRSQMYIYWGNILYEHSQVEFRLGLLSWSKLLETGLLKFEAAGVSPPDISIALQKHLSSSLDFQEL